MSSLRLISVKFSLEFTSTFSLVKLRVDCTFEADGSFSAGTSFVSSSELTEQAPPLFSGDCSFAHWFVPFFLPEPPASAVKIVGRLLPTVLPYAFPSSTSTSDSWALLSFKLT